MNKAHFISIEGIEGVGKTTIVQYIGEQLTQNKIDYIITREPGGTVIAEAIRNVLLGHYEEVMSPDAELLLMFSGRAQNIAQVILPALQRGQWVISDRFTDASYAYQGGGRGVSMRHIAQLEEWVQGELRPHLTILLDAPAQLGLSRVKSRIAKDRIELEGEDFFIRVRETYLQLAKQNPQRIKIINAQQSLEQVKMDVLSTLQTLLPETV